MQPTSDNYARITGFFYLLIAIFGFISLICIPAELVVKDNPADSFAKYQAETWMIGFQIFAAMIMIFAEVIVCTTLYLELVAESWTNDLNVIKLIILISR